MELSLSLGDLVLCGLEWGARERESKVLCLHGRLDNAASFSGLAPLLALDDDPSVAGRHVVALDLPGHGRSPWFADGVYSTDRMASIVPRALDALGWRSPCVCVAHSAACVFALVAAGAFPERFSHVVFIEGFGGFGASSVVVVECSAIA